MENKETIVMDDVKKAVNEEIKKLAQGLQVDRIEGFKESDSQIEITKALIAFHLDIESIPKDNTNPFYRSKYANLDTILKAVNPLLAKHDLILMQSAEDAGNDKVYIKTKLKHSSGEYIESNSAPFKPAKTNDIQARGALETYLRRYAVQSVLALSFEEDDDGNSLTNKSKGKSDEENTTVKKSRV
ncbi:MULTISPECIES: ERF family protein [unclassified Clostridioides]|uniref:ERF family protein n=1 Tax=unclassified Clostridioides TaxID=2635829 RepID=UPI001D1288F7|nr:ERF family protein [Clostridioides sp. ES-S-0049-03]MCC0705371.1 ERF family protein [Clostridioides sp. ES-S-0049-02]